MPPHDVPASSPYAYKTHDPLVLAKQGGVALLVQQCETVSASHRGNDLPLLWPIHAKHRVLLFRLLDLMDVQSATQDHILLAALAVVSSLRHARRNDVECGLDLGFASPRWQAFIAKRRAMSGTLDRRAPWKFACSSTWPVPCRLATCSSSVPKPSPTIARSSYPGPSAKPGCQATAPPSASPNGAKTSRPP